MAHRPQRPALAPGLCVADSTAACLTMSLSTASLPVLCDDVLIHVARMAIADHPKRNLDGLRATSRSLRQFCLPIIYKDTVIKAAQDGAPFSKPLRRILDGASSHLLPLIKSIHIYGWVGPSPDQGDSPPYREVTTMEILALCDPLPNLTHIIIDQITWLNAFTYDVPPFTLMPNISSLSYLSIEFDRNSVIEELTHISFIQRFPNLQHFDLVPSKSNSTPFPGLAWLRTNSLAIPSVAISRVLPHHELLLNFFTDSVAAAARSLYLELHPYGTALLVCDAFRSIGQFTSLERLVVAVPLWAYHALDLQDRYCAKIVRLITAAPVSLSSLVLEINGVFANDTPIIDLLGHFPVHTITQAAQRFHHCSVEFALRTARQQRVHHPTWELVQEAYPAWRKAALCPFGRVTFSSSRRDDIYYNFPDPCDLLVPTEFGEEYIIPPVPRVSSNAL